MFNLAEYKRKHNLERRKERRSKLCDFPDTSAKEFWLDPDMFPVPSIQDVKDALSSATHSKEDILNMAGIMELVSMHYSPRLLDDEKCRGRTSGIREFLRQNGYLFSRYSTLMRYKALSDEIRIALGLEHDRFWSFRIGMLAENPDPIDDYWYPQIRAFIAGISGENYKDIFAYVHAKVLERRKKEDEDRVLALEMGERRDRMKEEIKRRIFGSYHHEVKKERVHAWWNEKNKPMGAPVDIKPGKKRH